MYDCSRFLLLLLLLFSLLSCRSTGASLDDFDKASRGYNRMIRWQEYEMAGSAFVDDSLKRAFASRITDLNKVKIVDYRASGVDFDEVKGTASVRVEFEYYMLPSPAVKKAVDMQQWRYSEEENRWYLETLLPEFK